MNPQPVANHTKGNIGFRLSLKFKVQNHNQIAAKSAHRPESVPMTIQQGLTQSMLKEDGMIPRSEDLRFSPCSKTNLGNATETIASVKYYLLREWFRKPPQRLLI